VLLLKKHALGRWRQKDLEFQASLGYMKEERQRERERERGRGELQDKTVSWKERRKEEGKIFQMSL
jgi:hypothetical protein